MHGQCRISGIPRNQSSQMNHKHDAPVPPANIATPSFGSDVAARKNRAALRAAVVQAPLLTLKMSTTLEHGPPAQGVKSLKMFNTFQVIHRRIRISVPLPQPFKQNHIASSKSIYKQRTITTGEQRDSIIRQRRGSYRTSRHAETRS